MLVSGRVRIKGKDISQTNMMQILQIMLGRQVYRYTCILCIFVYICWVDHILVFLNVEVGIKSLKGWICSAAPAMALFICEASKVGAQVNHTRHQEHCEVLPT